jgi:hypothetical protein
MEQTQDLSFGYKTVAVLRLGEEETLWQNEEEPTPSGALFLSLGALYFLRANAFRGKFGIGGRPSTAAECGIARSITIILL